MNRRTFFKTTAATVAFASLPKLAFAQTPSGTPDAAQQTIGGNAHDLVPQGTTNDVEIVSIGGIDGESVQVVIRNNSDKAVGVEEVVGVVRDAAGNLVLTTESSTTAPYLVEAGGIAIGHVYFGSGNNLDPNATFELEVEYEEPRDSRQDLVVTEVAPSPDGIIGIATNQSQITVTGPITVLVVYLDDTGTPTGYAATFAEKDTVAPNKTTPFNATANGTVTENFLIGVVGWTF